MNTWIIVVILSLIVLAYLFYRGNKRLKEIKKVEESVYLVSPSTAVDKVVYHGGFPPMPKPAHLKIGFSEEYIVLYDSKGMSGRVGFEYFRKIDKFTTRKNPDLKGKSVFLWGPLVPFISKAKIKNFLVINYIDIDNEENNIVLEIRDATQLKQLYERADKCWHNYKREHRAKANIPSAISN